MKIVCTFGHLGVRKQYSKAVYQIDDRNLKLAFVANLYDEEHFFYNRAINWSLPLKV